MTWAFRLNQNAVRGLYQLDRELVGNIWTALHKLAIDPDSANLQTDEVDPSLYWIAVEGDFTVWFELLDEQHVICVVKIG